MHARIPGPLANLIFAVVAVFGFLLALGEVLDFYDAWWKITVPLTLVYAAVIWVFALGTPKDEAEPAPTLPELLFINLVKIFLTVAALFTTLGVVALIWDLVRLIQHNWHYIVVALGLVVVIVIVAFLMPDSRKKKKTGAKRAGKVARKPRAH